MNHIPAISIIIPTLNEERFLPRLLQDLEKQTEINFEVHVVDGGSKDRTVSIAKTLARKDSRFHVLKASTKSVSYQRNAGAQKAKASYILFLDADTRIPATFLKKILHNIQKKPADIFTTFAAPDTKKFTDKLLTSANNALTVGSALLKKPYAFGACLGCTKAAFTKVGGFDSKLSFQEDADFIQRIVNTGMKFEIYPRPEYVFSMRRYEKDGAMNVILKTLPYSIKSFITNDFQIDSKDYPMDGGLNK